MDYAGNAATQEWDRLPDVGPNDPTSKTPRTACNRYYDFVPADARQRSWYELSLAKLNEFGESRRIRRLESQASVPPVLWVLLVAGAAITITSTWMFELHSSRRTRQACGMTAFILFWIMALEHPCQGDVPSRRPSRPLSRSLRPGRGRR